MPTGARTLSRAEEQCWEEASLQEGDRSLAPCEAGGREKHGERAGERGEGRGEGPAGRKGEREAERGLVSGWRELRC